MRVFALMQVSAFNSDRPQLVGIVTDAEIANKWLFHGDTLIKYFENMKVDDPDFIRTVIEANQKRNK
jgi:hypothetical protein